MGLTLFLLPLQAFPNLLSNKNPKTTSFLEGIQCYRLSNAKLRESSQEMERFSPHILKSLLQCGADVGLDAGPLLPFPSKHLVHRGVGIGGAHGRIQRSRFWGKREGKRDLQEDSELFSFPDTFCETKAPPKTDKLFLHCGSSL